jgi:hypothetical protein
VHFIGEFSQRGEYQAWKREINKKKKNEEAAPASLLPPKLICRRE